jgi:beta-mannosidase
MPRNMGSLYWQLDDCWPVASWSSIDYFGRWKALQYYAKRFYSPVLVSPFVETDNLKLLRGVGSDSGEQRLSQCRTERPRRRETDKPQERSCRHTLQSQSYLSVPIKTLLNGRNAKTVMVYCDFVSEGKVISTNEYFFEPFKNLSLPTAQINFDVVKVRSGYKVTLATNKLAKSVYLSTKTDGFFSDNYFDLFPDKPVEVEFRTRMNIPVEEFRNQLKVRSLKDAFGSGEVTVTNK